MYNIVSLFSGAGGFDLGFENEDFNIIWANEFDKKIWETYEYNHPDTFLDKRSITVIKSAEIPDCDGIIGSPPCQSWSSCGCNKGINDPRGKLFYDYIRILKEKQPKFFVVENVRGLLFRRNKEAFEDIITQFKECGYNVKYKLIDTSEYGVPQTRKRVFIIGYRNDIGIRFDFDKLEKTQKPKTLKNAIGDLPDSLPAQQYNKTNGDINPPNHEYCISTVSTKFKSSCRIRSWNQPSCTILASERATPFHPDYAIQCDGKITFDSNNPRIRKLGVRECARIQTFPDSFKFIYESIRTGLMMVGNAVPPLMAQQLAHIIKKDLKEVETR